jgi:hypothetical protein
MGTHTTAMITRTKDDRAYLHSLLRHHVIKRGFGLGRRLRRQLSAVPNLYAAPLGTSTFAFQQIVVCCGLHLRRSLAVAQQLCILHRSVLHTQSSGRESTVAQLSCFRPATSHDAWPGLNQLHPGGSVAWPPGHT